MLLCNHIKLLIKSLSLTFHNISILKNIYFRDLSNAIKNSPCKNMELRGVEPLAS